jgi:hypothetical protein
MRKEPRSWTPPVKLAIMAIRRGLAGLTMRRLVLLLCVLAAGALPAQAKALRFPLTGKHAFLIDLPKGWQTKTDARGGLLLIPPSQSQHAMIYLAIIVDDKLRGQPVNAIAAAAAKSVGVETFDKEEPARMTDPTGAVLRGTAFYGQIPEPRGLSRKAKIVIFPLEPNTWAQAWTVTQPGMNPVEYKAIDQVLNNITLTTE